MGVPLYCSAIFFGGLHQIQRLEYKKIIIIIIIISVGWERNLMEKCTWEDYY